MKRFIALELSMESADRKENSQDTSLRVVVRFARECADCARRGPTWKSFPEFEKTAISQAAFSFSPTAGKAFPTIDRGAAGIPPVDSLVSKHGASMPTPINKPRYRCNDRVALLAVRNESTLRAS